MRIVGGKDYYDYGLAYGVDQEVVFVRTGSQILTREVPGNLLQAGAAPRIKAQNLKSSDWRSRYTCWEHNNVFYALDSVRVIFCGQYFGGARVSWRPRSSQYDHFSEPSRTTAKLWQRETFWDQNSLGKFLAKCGASIDYKPATFKGVTKPFERFKLAGPALEYVLHQRIVVATNCAEDCGEFKLPGRAYSSTENYWIVNQDNLKHLHFIKIFDPTQAFQQISMWVGGVLPKPGNPMVQITDDKIKLAKHGLDATSFRKPPQKAR